MKYEINVKDANPIIIEDPASIEYEKGLVLFLDENGVPCAIINQDSLISIIRF